MAPARPSLVLAVAVGVLLTASAGCARSSSSSTSSDTAGGAPVDTAAPTTSTTRPATTPAPDAVTLFDFADPAAVDGWRNVDDPVMGGRSSSAAVAEGGALIFRGSVSLENNGGFASIVSPVDRTLGAEAAGARSLRLHATGDGKTYVVQARVEGTRNAYITRVETTAGTAEVYDLPVDDFRPVNFMLEPADPGDPDTPATLDPSRIVQFSIYILDKQVGPFELRVTRLDVVR